MGYSARSRGEIERRNRAGGGEEQRQIDHQHLKPSLIETHNHRRQQNDGHENHQRIADVGGEVEKSFGLDRRREHRRASPRQDFLRGLHQALGPARLLRLEGVHLHRQFGRAVDFRQIEKLPAADLRAIGKIGVFGERVVLPAARVFNGGAAPDARGAVEIEEQTAAEARRMLDGKVAVEQDRFRLR